MRRDARAVFVALRRPASFDNTTIAEKTTLKFRVCSTFDLCLLRRNSERLAHMRIWRRPCLARRFLGVAPSLSWHFCTVMSLSDKLTVRDLVTNLIEWSTKNRGTNEEHSYASVEDELGASKLYSATVLRGIQAPSVCVLHDLRHPASNQVIFLVSPSLF
ncbi:hypothetical protein IWX90DRAFT_271796 [Phyllosticta citrichinensis]|uniref:Uncharacterized protein n=1 Tax=Phyllosticta citrichinensis TaxID=1130410 RepID=A0ABR1XMT9_9PEZI